MNPFLLMAGLMGSQVWATYRPANVRGGLAVPAYALGVAHLTIPEIMAALKAIVAGAETEGRTLNDDEIAEYEAKEVELAAAQKSAVLFARQKVREQPVIDGFPAVIHATPKGDEALEFAFTQYLRTGQKNDDIAQLFAQGTESGSVGGYLVPEGFRAKIVERMKAFGGVANAAEQLVTASGNVLPWPTIDDTANEAEIVAEHAAPVGGADLAFGTAQLGAFKYVSTGPSGVPLRVSVELLQDAFFDVGAFVAKALGKRIARKFASDVVIGDGSGEPLGINRKIPGLTLATGNPITYAKLVAATHLIDPEYRDGASWVFNDTSLGLVEGMVDGNGRPLWLPSADSGIGRLGGGNLLGYPVIIDQAMPAVANGATLIGEGFALFGDIDAAYIVRRVKDVQLVVDPYGRAANGEVQYTAWARMDGTIQDPNAYVAIGGYDAP